MGNIRVLVVDDSQLMRDMLSEILNQASDIEVCGTAVDPFDAREKTKQLKPDVITLDIEMPKMSGVTFLKNLMRLHPIPVIMVSTLTTQGSDASIEALENGAIDIVAKPKFDNPNRMQEYQEELVEKIRAAAKSKLNLRTKVCKKVERKQIELTNSSPKVVAIGSSTGGLEALSTLLHDYPLQAPGIVIAQHIPPGFSKSFANRMNGRTDMIIKEATEGALITPGIAYIAPGSHHLEVVCKKGIYQCHLHEGEKVNRHRPSVDVLFNSVADIYGDKAIGVILTGMGNDGAGGLKRMRDRGAITVAQNEATSVVWGMPGSAVRLGATNEVLGLEDIVSYILEQL